MNIENYLKPLTNNERAVLFYAAGLRRFQVERTPDLWADLSKYAPKRTKVPAAQVDKAVESLVAKGYITMEPKRGNYWFSTRRGYYGYSWSRMRPHNGLHTTMMDVFREKSAGMHKDVDWVHIADLKTVEPVFDAVVAHRRAQDISTLEEQVRKSERVALRQQELENAMLRMCEEYATRFREDSPIRNRNSDESISRYLPYECDDLIGKIQQAAKELDRWTYTRRDIEREGKQAVKELAEKVAA